VVPDLGWAAAITLGAIVAPPDASAASAVLRRLQPPHRLLVILEGESLFNDAAALLIYRIAVGAAITGAFSAWSIVPTLLLTCGGGVIAGYVFARLQVWLLSKIDDVPIRRRTAVHPVRIRDGHRDDRCSHRLGDVTHGDRPLAATQNVAAR